jgi:hypothetical protein
MDPRSITAEAAAEKIEWIRSAAGERFDELVLDTYSTAGPVVVTKTARAEHGGYQSPGSAA